MTMLDTLATALENVDKLGHLLRTHYSKEKKCVYAIVEGKDDLSYYSNPIQSVLPDDWSLEPLTADSKYQAIKCYQGIDWTIYSREQLCFFLDRDLSDFINEAIPQEKNIYITRGYSIENDIITSGVFKRVIREVFGIDKISNDDLVELEKKCEVALRHFSESLMPLMAQIIFWKSDQSSASRKLDLDQFKIGELIEINNCCLIIKAKDQIITSISQKYERSEAPIQKIDEILASMSSKSDPMRIIRGKYLLCAFVKYCIHIGENIHRLFPEKYSQPVKPKSSLSRTPLLHIAPRSKQPENLKSFIRSNYMTFINQLELRPALPSDHKHITPA